MHLCGCNQSSQSRVPVKRSAPARRGHGACSASMGDVEEAAHLFRQKKPMINNAITPNKMAVRKPPILVRSIFVNAATKNAPNTVAHVTASAKPIASTEYLRRNRKYMRRSLLQVVHYRPYHPCSTSIRDTSIYMRRRLQRSIQDLYNLNCRNGAGTGQSPCKS